MIDAFAGSASRSLPGEALGLLGRPTDLLFESAQFGLRLGGDDDRARSVRQGQVDHPTDRPNYRDFRFWTPTWVEPMEDGLDDRRLEAILETRS